MVVRSVICNVPNVNRVRGISMKALLVAAASAAMIAGAPASAATYIVSANSTGTSLGTIIAGKTYKFTTTGTVDLVGDQIPGGSFNVNADGIPVGPVTAPSYGYFNPNGSDIADGVYGPGGPGVNFGSLIGTFGGNYFKIGTSLTQSFATGGALFARINDINENNSGSFTVNVTAVPEPATWAMMISGFGMVGGLMRTRARKTRLTYAA